jgi:hypothetical protein
VMEPLESFARHVRAEIAGDVLVIENPKLQSLNGIMTIKVLIVGAARDPTPRCRFARVYWESEPIPGPMDWGTDPDSEMSDFLAVLLQRDFPVVERYDNELELSRAVERRWPCYDALQMRKECELIAELERDASAKTEDG